MTCRPRAVEAENGDPTQKSNKRYHVIFRVYIEHKTDGTVVATCFELNGEILAPTRAQALKELRRRLREYLGEGPRIRLRVVEEYSQVA
jgi:hypothetical protein